MFLPVAVQPELLRVRGVRSHVDSRRRAVGYGDDVEGNREGEKGLPRSFIFSDRYVEMAPV